MSNNSFLDVLELEKKYQSDEKSVAMTIRVSAEDDKKIKDLMEEYELSRQDLIHKALENSVFTAWSELSSKDNDAVNDDAFADNDAKESSKQNFYLLNTNTANDMEDHRFMMKNQVVATFEDGYTHKIKNMKSGATVFLYESGVGIVAYGIAGDTPFYTDHYGIPNKTCYRHLEGFTLLGKPLAAKKIKEILNRKIPFMQTMIALPDGDKLLQYIAK